MNAANSNFCSIGPPRLGHSTKSTRGSHPTGYEHTFAPAQTHPRGYALVGKRVNLTQ